jgi:predicted MFS family arabinose efflux permease
MAALSVFVMFFVVLVFFKEPQRSGETNTASIAETLRNFVKVLGNPKFMAFLLIFSGYWIVYWQEFISLPLYVHDYINPTTNTDRMLSTGPLVVIALTVAMSVATKKMAPFSAVILGTIISMAAFAILAIHSSVTAVYAMLVVVALGEIIQSPRYYEYISRLAPPGQQGTYMGFAFLPIGIGSLIGGWFGGRVMHQFAEVAHQPQRVWWVISGVGVLTALLLWIYDRVVKPSGQEASA